MRASRNRNAELIIAVLLGLIIMFSFFAALLLPVFAQAIIIRRQTIQVGFQGQWEEIVTTYIFGVDGSLNVESTDGSQFFFAAPKFQPTFPPIVELSENETFVMQHFYISDGVKTLDLWVYYNFGLSQQQVKISLIGTTNDEDSEIEYEFENPKSLDYSNIATSYSIGTITFDWNDLEGATVFEAYLNRLKIKFASNFNLDPSIVTSAASSTALYYSHQDKMLYDVGLWWIFYHYGSFLCYRTSSDGATWSAATYAAPTTGTYQLQAGYRFYIWHHSPKVTYAIFTTSPSNALLYRTGTLNAGGTVTWATTEQTVTTSGLYSEIYPAVSVDSSSYPYVLYRKSDGNLTVTKSQFNNGTWSTALGYPVDLTTSGAWFGVIHPLSSGKMYALYNRGGYLYGHLYNGATWGVEESVGSSPVTTNNFGAVVIGDTVFLAFRSLVSSNLKFLKRVYGTGWTSETTLQGSRFCPRLSAVGTTEIYLFSQDTENFYIQYRTYTIADDSWTTEGTVTEPSLTYSLQTTRTSTNNYEIGYAFQTNQVYTTIKFGKITIQPPEIPEEEVPGGNPLTPTGEEEEKPPPTEIEEKPSILPKLGVWGLLGAVGLITIGGIAYSLDQPTRSSRHRSPKPHRPSSYHAKQPAPSYYHKPPKSQVYRRIK